MSYQKDISKLFTTPLPQKVKKREKRDYRFIFMIVLTSILGFSAGVVGQLVSNNYISSVQYFTMPSQNILLQEEKSVDGISIDQDDLYNRTALFYTKNSVEQELGSIFYESSQAVAQGAILTSDGWIITSQEAIKGISKSMLLVQVLGSLYDVEDIIVDQFSGVVFVKIQADGLPVSKLGNAKDLSLLQSVYALNSNGLGLYQITDLNHANPLKKSILDSSDSMSNFLSIEGWSKLLSGSAVVNSNEEIIGLVAYSLDDYNSILLIPVDQIKMIMGDVLTSRRVDRPWLGVNYLSLSKYKSLDESLTYGLDRGALIISDSKHGVDAILAQSPARDLLKENDIVLRLEGIEINNEYSLSELIQQYKPGANLEFLVLRDGKEINVKVILDKFPE